MKQDNRGFSLVELIIVVAIMSTMIGVAGYGLSLSSGKPAEQCARNLAAVLQHARTNTMGKYRNVITVKNDGGKLTVQQEYIVSIADDGTTTTNERSNVVGSKGVSVSYEINDSGSYATLAEGDSVTLRFDSGSGALKKTTPDGNGYYTGFCITKANKTYYVKIETLTGRISVNTSDS